MKWLSPKGLRNFEECVELTIDFENRKFTLEYYFNHQMGGGGNSETFAFEEAAGEKLHGLIEYYGSGAKDEFYRILKMSKAQFESENLENKEVLIDMTVNQ